MPDEALHHAVAARDDDRAVAIVKEHAWTYIIAGDGATLLRWIAKLPPERVESDFDLLILHSLGFTAENQLENAERALERAEQFIPPDQHDRGEGAVLSLRAMIERMFGRPDAAVAMLERAMTLLDPTDFFYSMTLFRLGVGAMVARDVRRAEEYLEHAADNRDRPDGLLTAALGRAYGAWCFLWRGFPDRARAMVDEANEWIDEWAGRHGTNRPLASLTYGVLGDLHRLRNELDSARESAEIALIHGRTGFFIGYVESLRVMSQIAEAQGDWNAALAAAREMACAVQCAGNIEMMGPVVALEYHAIWRRGQVTGQAADLERVSRWSEESGFLDIENWRGRLHAGLYGDYSLMIGARVLIHRGRYEEALRLLDVLLEDAVAAERVLAQISLLVLRSLAEAGRGHGENAVTAMQEALEIASEPGYVRLFLDEGTATLPILERAAARATCRDFATRVLSAFEIPVRVRAASAPAQESLSEREIEVLRLIAAGDSNQDAARKLFVAPSTVKKHLENIYAKLGVGGRTQAVARARELQIL
jgi:LuxR family maltose regulon positive regulatory protein